MYVFDRAPLRAIGLSPLLLQRAQASFDQVFPAGALDAAVSLLRITEVHRESFRLHDGSSERGARAQPRLLRQLLDRYVPRTLIDRPKVGFAIPLDAWLRGPLRDWAEALLAEDRLRREGFFHPAQIRAAWQRHLTGEASLGVRLWSVLMFQAWLETQGGSH